MPEIVESEVQSNGRVFPRPPLPKHVPPTHAADEVYALTEEEYELLMGLHTERAQAITLATGRIEGAMKMLLKMRKLEGDWATTPDLKYFIKSK